MDFLEGGNGRDLRMPSVAESDQATVQQRRYGSL